MKSTLSCWKADGISPRNISQQVMAVRLLKKEKLLASRQKTAFYIFFYEHWYD